jgi:hypothetical protein
MVFLFFLFAIGMFYFRYKLVAPRPSFIILLQWAQERASMRKKKSRRNWLWGIGGIFGTIVLGVVSAAISYYLLGI